MKTFQIPTPGAIEALTLVERETPRPGPHEVLVRVRATALNYRDLMVALGRYARGTAKPNLVPLSDGAGEVAEVGAGVTRVKAGDRVAAAFMPRWIGGDVTEEGMASALGGAADGMLSEYVALHEDGLVHLPPHLSFEEGATLPCAAVTVWHGLMTQGHLTAGDTVLVQGTGGVSIFGLQFAKAGGARVIATSSSDAKLTRALALGASDGINYTVTADWDAEAKRLTGGRGVDHVVEVGGAGTFARSLSAVRHGGTISLIGVLSGAATIDPMPILRRGVTVRGIYVGSREMFEAMNRAIALHRIRPVIDRVFDFTDAAAAYRHLQSGAHFGKIVIAVP